MSTLAIAAVVIAVTLVGALAAWVATRPSHLHVERAGSVGAPPAVVFDVLNTLTRWPQWSPYDKRDPAMKRSFSGPASGPGASYAWSGNGQVGEGRMTISEVKAPERVTMRLEFVRPFKCDNVVNYHIAPAAGGCRVIWAMDGKSNTLSKLMSLFIDMDKMVGKDFEQGLANLDALLRSPAESTASAA